MQIGELKHGTRFYVYSSCNDKDDKPFLCEYDEHYPGTIWCIDDDRCTFNYKIDFMRILNYKVEILEDEEETGISELEKEKEKVLEENPAKFRYDLRYYYDKEKMGDKINEIIKKVNELDKKINKED